MKRTKFSKYNEVPVQDDKICILIDEAYNIKDRLISMFFFCLEKE